MTLKERILRRAAALGPMTVAEFMTACLHDPFDGYYATRPALGEDGDFLTAPMVSQVFGELIGLWSAAIHAALEGPRRFLLVELGPGDGAMMSDALRAARQAPGFLDAAELWLVETSPVLRRLQAERLAPWRPRFAAHLGDLPVDAPMIAIGNEFLDCLPSRQFVRTERGWSERVVAAQGGELVFGLAGATAAQIPTALRSAPVGAVVEVSTLQRALAAALARRVSDQGGAALLIDYGRLEPTFGSTLQALARHSPRDPFEAPGRADLTVHADFSGVLEAAGAAVDGDLALAATTQGRFLRALGAERRFDRLEAARPDLVDRLRRQRARLLDDAGMGALFKVLVMASAGLDVPGFNEAPQPPLPPACVSV